MQTLPYVKEIAGDNTRNAQFMENNEQQIPQKASVSNAFSTNVVQIREHAVCDSTAEIF